MPSKRIVILDRPDRLDPNTVRYVLWADVPVARQPFYANPAATSAWKDAAASDITALQTGAMVERLDSLQAPPGATVAQIQAFLQARWTDYQNAITNINLWQRYGTFWDGTTWTPGGVA